VRHRLDHLVHELIAPGGAAVGRCAGFGSETIAADGGLDRAWMRARAFSSSCRRVSRRSFTRVCGLPSPRIRIGGGAYTVLVIPLLVNPATGRACLVRSSVRGDAARARADGRISILPSRGQPGAQADRATRLAAADEVLFNEAPLADLQPRVARLHALYCSYAANADAAHAL
jgi:dephospho-CoA kinase